MRMDNLKDEIEKFIIKKILKGENATQFYLEAIKFNSETMIKACEDLIVLNLAKIAESE